MKKNSNEIVGKVLIISMIIISVIFYFINAYQTSNIRTNGKYTIGYPKKIIQTTKRSKVLIYYYSVNSEIYTSSSDINGISVKLNCRYFVKYSTKNPENSLIFFDKIVLDSIKKAPLNGWKELP